MSTGLSKQGEFTRFTTFGFGWATFPFEEEEDVCGIKQLEIVGGGALKAIWYSPPEGTNFINIYVRLNNPDIFHEVYLAWKVQGDLTEAKFRTEADNNTLLNSMDMVYVGVRCENEDCEESTNTNVLWVRPATMGENVWVNDTHVSLLL